MPCYYLLHEPCNFDYLKSQIIWLSILAALTFLGHMDIMAKIGRIGSYFDCEYIQT